MHELSYLELPGESFEASAQVLAQCQLKEVGGGPPGGRPTH